MVKRVTQVIRNNIRKANSIKKYENMYYVPIANIGLLELNRRKDHWDDEEYTDEYYGGISGDAIAEVGGQFVEIPIQVSVDMRIGTMSGKKVTIGNGKYSWHNEIGYYDGNIQGFQTSFTEYSSIPEDLLSSIIYERYNENTVFPEEFTQEYRNQIRHDFSEWSDMVDYNMRGVQRVLIYGTLTFYAGAKTENDYPIGMEEKFTDYESIDDFINAVAEKANSIWSLIITEYESRHLVDFETPEFITVQTPIGVIECEGRDEYGQVSYHYGGYGPYSGKILCEQDNIEFRTNFSIIYAHGGSGFKASVTNTIVDKNEKVYLDRDRPNSDSPGNWSRNFEYQNESLDGIIAQVSSAIAETYTEWSEYVASAREYESVNRGRGRNRGVENSNEWIYYDEDSPSFKASARKSARANTIHKSFNSMVKSQRIRNKR